MNTHQFHAAVGPTELTIPKVGRGNATESHKRHLLSRFCKVTWIALLVLQLKLTLAGCPLICATCDVCCWLDTSTICPFSFLIRIALGGMPGGNWIFKENVCCKPTQHNGDHRVLFMCLLFHLFKCDKSFSLLFPQKTRVRQIILRKLYRLQTREKAHTAKEPHKYSVARFPSQWGLPI